MMNDRVKHPKNLWRSPWLVLAIGLVLVGLFRQPAVYQIGERAALTLARPFWFLGARAAAILGQLSDWFSRRAALQDENERLRSELNRLTARELELKRLTLDNAALGEILNRPRPEIKMLTAARVITRPAQSPGGVILVDVGSVNAARPPAPGDIVTAAGAAIGEVAAVYPKTVKIELYSDAGKKLAVRLGEKRLPAEARGRGGGNFSASLPRDLTLVPGDLVMLASARGEYLLGEIRVINRDPTDAFQEILFRSPVNLELLSWVEIYGQ